ncbi:L,D-transpeptidase [Methylocystis sp. WRRC1]|uniref:L,D-transpeptidase n=1 Tax=unclassified Methylocystis TaxID=2625913 RepID=UPI0001F86ECE|nr:MULTISPECIES: L,D-transpeptidase [unclassified Methylocystis]MCC3243979.1 L,D-transpeptidase [Methylocystis sp. WRRC1]
MRSSLTLSCVLRRIGRRSLHSLLLGAVVALGIAAAPQTASARNMVAFSPDVQPGTIVISAHQRRLFYVVGPGVAISYPVAVPKRGKEWSGVTSVDGKYVNPDWTPPAAVKADHPELPNLIPGGSPRNPMGVAALTLDRGEVAIHGTTSKMRASIGTAASYGCIRMLNEDVADLYGRVSVGAPVVMAP